MSGHFLDEEGTLRVVYCVDFNPLPLSEFLLGHECLKRNWSRYRVNSHSGLPPVRSETVSIFCMLCFPNHAFIFIAIIPGRKQHIPGPFPSRRGPYLVPSRLSLGVNLHLKEGGKEKTFLLFLLPLVPSASSPVTRVSRSPLFPTKVRKRSTRGVGRLGPLVL